MIKPPGDTRRAAIFKVDDGIFVAVEFNVVKQCTGSVQEAREDKFNVVTNTLAVETGKDCSRRCAVKTFVVVVNVNFQPHPFKNRMEMHKRLGMPLPEVSVKQSKRSRSAARQNYRPDSPRKRVVPKP